MTCIVTHVMANTVVTAQTGLFLQHDFVVAVTQDMPQKRYVSTVENSLGTGVGEGL